MNKEKISKELAEISNYLDVMRASFNNAMIKTKAGEDVKEELTQIINSLPKIDRAILNAFKEMD